MQTVCEIISTFIALLIVGAILFVAVLFWIQVAQPGMGDFGVRETPRSHYSR